MNSKTIIPDIKAGIVVFLIAIPLCLGIALACKTPLFSGILAGIIGGILVTIFSGSVLSVSGPAAGLTAIVLSAVATLGSYEVFAAAVLFAGIVQIILGFIKAGSLGNFIPNAVIKGMLAGIGIILIIKQIPHLVGYDADPEGDFEFFQTDGQNTFSDLVLMLNNISPGAIVIGLFSVLILIISEKEFYRHDKILSNIPGPLLVVLFGILLRSSFSTFKNPIMHVSNDHMVSLPVISGLNDLISNIVTPDFSLLATSKFWLVVITLAIVASLESLLSIEAVDKLDPQKRVSDSDKELFAQGIGNVLCGLIGALPVTAVIVRGSANIHAGAKSKWSAIFHALLLLISILLFPKILMMIPNSSLAAILIVTGYKLARPSLFKDYYYKGKTQVIPFVTTIVVMLVSDPLIGVAMGMAVSIFFIIRSNIRSSFEVADQIIDNKHHYLIKLPQHVTFFNKGFLIKYLNRIKHNSVVILDGTINKATDPDVREVINDFIKNSKNKQIELSLIKYSV